VGLLVNFWCYVLSLGHRWALIAIVAGPTQACRHLALCIVHHRWVVTWPVLVVIGGPISRRWVTVRAYSLSLECRRALLVFIGSRRCWVVLLFVIGSSFPHAGVIRMTMVGIREHHELTRGLIRIRPAGISFSKNQTRSRTGKFPRMTCLNGSGTCRITDHLQLTGTCGYPQVSTDTC
jgi:hypothetical protein